MTLLDFPAREHDGSGLQSTLSARADAVGTIAAVHAEAVDRDGRFPHEALKALKDHALLGAMVPEAFGGEGAPLADMAEICSRLGQECASAGMMFAMHQIKMASLVGHGRKSGWHMAFMRRIATEQLLIASSTTEAGIGGDLRNSICAVAMDGDELTLEKEASVISYGAYADAILATARRAPDAPSSDQVLVALLKGQYRLERTSGWDTLGMRGTCSEGFKLRAKAPACQILPKPFAEIAAQSMLASSHLLWASLWYGIAAGAVAKTQNFLRGEARKKPSQMPPGALHMAEAASQLQALKSTIAANFEHFERCEHDSTELMSMGFSIAMNNVKLAASRTVFDIVQKCMLVCGLAGYRNDTPFSMGRHLRDAMSAQLMISNDRILMNTSTMLLVHRLDPALMS